MNNNAAQGPTAGGQQTHPTPPRAVFFRPEQMRNLPEGFTPEEKKKWENGLIMLYKQMETHPQDSQQHQDARKKVQEFSLSLQKKILQNRAQQAQAGGSGQAAPTTQNVSQAQVPADGAAPQNTPQQNRPVQSGVKPSEQMMQHINNFPYVLPPTLAAGTPEANRWIQETKNKYGKALLTMENAAHNLKLLETMVKGRAEKGNPLNETEMKEYQTKKEQFQKTHADARRYSENFRKQQEEQTAGMAASGQQNGTAAQPAPQRPTMNLNQQAPTTGMPGSESVNAAIQAARNSSINASRPPTAGQPGTQNEQTPLGQGINTLSSNGQPAPVKAEGVKVEGGPSQPQINTAMATAPHMQGQMARAQNSPHSAVPQSATSVTGREPPPRPLTQQAALSQAARTYSSSQTSATPNVMGAHSHPSVARETPNINAVKMPIPKQLPTAAIGTPIPVSMAPSRPTMSGGPNNSGNGLMGQPALTKTPGFTIVGDGQRVMEKKKLDELVRQVTGGGEGMDIGEVLTPDVEDCVHSIADEFIDQVVTAACKCAKARGSKVLEIRDIQLILERNYNIRIPGYASDEIRTVRKFQPAQGWIAKMSAIQAAKVTGGRGDS